MRFVRTNNIVSLLRIKIYGNVKKHQKLKSFEKRKFLKAAYIQFFELDEVGQMLICNYPCGRISAC